MRNLRNRINSPARILAALAIASAMVWLLCSAQAQYRGRRNGRRDARYAERMREQELMEKAINPAFTNDVFTFARLRFDDNGGYGRFRGWNDDSPDADLNVIYRLFEATSMKVRPGINFIDITADQMADYPFVYMAGAGRATFDEQEAATLRDYMLKGGFMMVDDFWGDEEWDHFYEQLTQIFPKRKPELMDLTHPIFHNVYNFKKQPQIPSVGDFFGYGTSYDEGHAYVQQNHDPHYYGIYDDKHRLMMLICHNNHYGDGWEHEGDDETYFDIFSMPMGYPMLINVVTYVMSH